MRRKLFRISIVIITIFVLFVSYSYATESFEIAKSCGGGFTATHNIYLIDQDGNVSQKVVSHILKNQNKEEIIGKINHKDAKELYADLMKIEFHNIKYMVPHSYSCSLGLTVDGNYHSVTWPGPSLPRELKKLEQILHKISKILDPLIEKHYKKEKERTANTQTERVVSDNKELKDNFKVSEPKPIQNE